MLERDVTFDGVSLVQDIGLTYSQFTEVLPEPAISVIDIPGGNSIDLSASASGQVGLGLGTHVLTFLLCASSQEERLAKKNRIITLLHGRRASYTLSWTGIPYYGRATVSFEHLWDEIDVVTITILHDTFSSSSQTVTIYPLGSSAGASSATVTYPLTGYYSYDVSVRTWTAGTAKLGSASAVTIDGTSTATHVGTAYQNGASEVNLVVTIGEWWVGTLSDDGRLVLSNSHFTVGEDAITDGDWALDGTDLKCANYTSVQKASVSVTRRSY